jgi:multiple sugar transport system permease protein
MTSLAASREVTVRRSGRVRRLRKRLTPYLFLAPFAIAFLAFVVYPLVYALNLSLYRYRIFTHATVFVGVDNYLRALSDNAFWDGVKNVLAFGVVQVPAMLAISLGAALLLDSALLRRATIFRLGFFIPFAVPAVVGALLWGYLYGQQWGPVAQICMFFNIQPPMFLSPDTIIPALANISTWQWAGYNMVIIFAALKAIPSELYEAARVDGASGIQIAWRIKIPMVTPALMLTFIFSIIGTLQLFNEPNVLRQVAPAAIGPNFTPNMYLYNVAFQIGDFYYSAAIAFSLAMVTMVLVGVVLVVNAWHSRRAA